MRLMGKVALVTGGGTGIGTAIALEFAKEGAKVAIAGRRLDKLQEVAKAIKKNGGEAIAITGDVSKPSDVDQMVKTTLDTFKKLDILVNCAGVLYSATLAQHTHKIWDDHQYQSERQFSLYPEGRPRNAKTREREDHQYLLHCRADWFSK